MKPKQKIVRMNIRSNCKCLQLLFILIFILNVQYFTARASCCDSINSLEEIKSASAQQLSKVVYLSLINNYNEIIDNTRPNYDTLNSILSQFHNLQHLELFNFNLVKFPSAILQNLNIKIIYLNSCNVLYIPDSLLMLNKLIGLTLDNNPISKLPINNLTKSRLEFLSLRNTNIKELPENISLLRKLRCIDISYTMKCQIPECIYMLKHLELLYMDDCAYGISDFPYSITRLCKLEELHISQSDVDPELIQKMFSHTVKIYK